MVGTKGEALLEGNKPDSYSEQVRLHTSGQTQSEHLIANACVHAGSCTLLSSVLLGLHLLSQAARLQVGGRSMAAAGCEPILHMRDFQKLKRLPEALEIDIYSRLGACDISAGPGACG